MLRSALISCAGLTAAACTLSDPDPRAAPQQPERDRHGETSPVETGGSGGDDAPVPPPQNTQPEDARTIERAYLIGPWAAKGGDCRRPDFDVSPIANTQNLSIETSVNGAPRTGEVRSGAGAAFVFDQPRTIFPLEKRRAQSLAVLAPGSGPVELGGRAIQGDGVVFVKCPETNLESQADQ